MPTSILPLIGSLTDALSKIPITAIYKERLELAADLASQLKRDVAALEQEKAALKAKLDTTELELSQCQQGYQALRGLHAEEVRIVRTIEFRRGLRTEGRWEPFCPRCHLPALSRVPRRAVHCSGRCGWFADLGRAEFVELLGQLNQTAPAS